MVKVADTILFRSGDLRKKAFDDISWRYRNLLSDNLLKEIIETIFELDYMDIEGTQRDLEMADERIGELEETIKEIHSDLESIQTAAKNLEPLQTGIDSIENFVATCMDEFSD